MNVAKERKATSGRNGDRHCTLPGRKSNKPAEKPVPARTCSETARGAMIGLGTPWLPVHAVLCGLLLLSARKGEEKAKAEVRVADPGLPSPCRGPRLTGLQAWGNSSGDLPRLQAIWGRSWGRACRRSSAGSPGPQVVASSLLRPKQNVREWNRACSLVNDCNWNRPSYSDQPIGLYYQEHRPMGQIPFPESSSLDLMEADLPRLANAVVQHPVLLHLLHSMFNPQTIKTQGHHIPRKE